MSREQKKRKLKQYLRLMNRIDRLEEKLLSMDERLYGVKSGTITDSVRGGQPFTMEDVVALKEETSTRINRLDQRANEVRKETIRIIDQLDDYNQVETLELFFIEGLTIEDIAERIGYGVRQTTRFYTMGVDALEM